MTAATPSAPTLRKPDLATDRPTAHFRTWIDSRFAGQRGFLCLGYIDGDPQIEDLRQKWYVYPLEAQRAAADLADYAARGFNLYMAPCLFSKRTRKYTYALPSIWLWADDVPAGTPCTDLVRSSEGSRQAWAQLDRPLSASDRKRLQSAWQQKLGADTCTSNAVHMGRVPGGYNCKRHGKFLVYVEQHSDRIYSADLLLSKAPATAERSEGQGEITALDMPQVEQHLANMDALLLSPRAQCIKPETQSGRILGGEMLIFPVNKRQDDSRSMNGYVLGNGFYMRGFSDDEIAAVMFYHYRKWGVERDKGTAWCKIDIGRSIARMHAEKPGVVQSPTRYRRLTTTAEPITDTPAASRARSDRPRQLDPLMLFNRYTSDPGLCELSRKPRAAALSISTATLDRLDAALRCEGLIDIDRPGRGLPGRVIIAGGVINIPGPGVLSEQPVRAAPDAPIAALVCAEAAQQPPQCIGETHQPPTPPSPPGALAATAPLARGARGGVCSPLQAPAGAPDSIAGWRVVRLTGRWALRGPKAECLWFGSEGAALQALARIGAAEQEAPTGWCKLVRGFDDSDQPELASFDPSAAPAPVAEPALAPVLVELDPLELAPPLPDEPAYGEFIWRYHAQRPGSIDKRTGKARAQSQRDRFRRDMQRYLVEVSPEEAALRWAALQRPQAQPGARIRAGVGDAPPSKPRRAVGPPLSQAQQATLFAGAL